MIIDELPFNQLCELKMLKIKLESEECSEIVSIQTKLNKLRKKLMQNDYQLTETKSGGFVLTSKTHSRHFIDFGSLFAHLVEAGLVSPLNPMQT